MAAVATNTGSLYDSVLILDFGSQYSHLIARRVRELGVYCELHPCTAKLATIPFKPKAVILSGGPSSVYEADAPHVEPGVFELGVPVLGICYGLQEIAWALGGEVLACDKREYGHAHVSLLPAAVGNTFWTGFSSGLKVWMSHGDQLSKLPPGFTAIGHTTTSPFAAVANVERQIYGLQFHPEVTHTPQGRQLLGNFVLNIAQCKADWTMESFIDREVQRIRAVCGDHGAVIGAVSGGVDSTVAAALMNRAIGDRYVGSCIQGSGSRLLKKALYLIQSGERLTQVAPSDAAEGLVKRLSAPRMHGALIVVDELRFHAILVDNGLLRLNEAKEAYHKLKEQLNVNLKVVDASEQFLSRLRGITDPERKRKIIGHTFIEVFEEEAKMVGDAEFLLQGTLYPDVIESVSFKGPSATIKTHHNVGGLLPNMKLKLIEPLRELFKDEVRHLGELLGLDEPSVWRHPFPGPGLAIRVLGEVTHERCEMLRKADAIYIEEIRKAGLYRQIGQAFAVLLPVKSVGVMGDKRTYEEVIALRAVETSDFMTADWFPMPYDVLKTMSTRIINEVKGINRVTYDISSKPPATIEWE